MNLHQFLSPPGPIESHQDPKLTPRDFWEREPRICDLMDIMTELEQDALAVMLQDMVEAYQFGRDYATPARELADWLLRLEQSKRKTASR